MFQNKEEQDVHRLDDVAVSVVISQADPRRIQGGKLQSVSYVKMI